MNASDPNARHDGEEPQAPAKLVSALKEPPARRVFVPPTLDDAILAAARRHLAQPTKSPLHVFRAWLVWPALATACVLLVGLVYFLARPGGSEKFAREDVNHDGRVDILDAFALARAAQSGAKSPAALDLNGDGVVDRRDAELIAVHAVKLEKGGRS